MKKTLIFKLFISLLIPIGLGSIAGMFTAQAVPGWYATLYRPSYAPPNWIFGPMWTILYILLGISFFIIWKEQPGKLRSRGILIFSVQMILNFGWSFIFFYYKMIGLALIEIFLLWISILLMLFHFYKIKRPAAYINIPYLLWVTFAAILNAGYYFLN